MGPQLVVQIASVEWTDYGLLRHASYLRLREDTRTVPRNATATGGILAWIEIS